MDTDIIISFKVTPSQEETIKTRALENGFDDISAYLKVVALKTQEFNHTSAGLATQEPTIELCINVTQLQNDKIIERMKESNCTDLSSYLQYVALHSVIYAVVEVRSTGNLDAMLARIAKAKK